MKTPIQNKVLLGVLGKKSEQIKAQLRINVEERKCLKEALKNVSRQILDVQQLNETIVSHS